MISTWVIEDIKTKNIYNYYERLANAKKDLELLEGVQFSLDECRYRILKLVGNRRCEGYHQYAIKYCGRVFLKEQI